MTEECDKGFFLLYNLKYGRASGMLSPHKIKMPPRRNVQQEYCIIVYLQFGHPFADFILTQFSVCSERGYVAVAEAYDIQTLLKVYSLFIDAVPVFLQEFVCPFAFPVSRNKEKPRKGIYEFFQKRYIWGIVTAAENIIKLLLPCKMFQPFQRGFVLMQVGKDKKPHCFPFLYRSLFHCTCLRNPS